LAHRSAQHLPPFEEPDARLDAVMRGSRSLRQATPPQVKELIGCGSVPSPHSSQLSPTLRGCEQGQLPIVARDNTVQFASFAD
jgi:hypothetical protein